MGVSLISILTLTASSHLYKAIDTGFYQIFQLRGTCLGSYIGALYILLILKLYRTIEYHDRDILQCRVPMALGHLNKNISGTSDYSHQPMVFIVTTLLSHISSMKPCTKASTGPIVSNDNLNK